MLNEIFGSSLAVCGGIEAFAVIDLSYPDGATATCSNGRKIITAKNTDGHWLFVIPTAGQWTLKAARGIDSDSVVVNVFERKIYTVTLSFVVEPLFLYNNGNQCIEITGGWNSRGWAATSNFYAGNGPSIAQNPSSMLIEWNYDADTDGGVVETGNDINLTRYKSITVISTSQKASMMISPRIVVGNRNAQYFADGFAYKTIAVGTDVETILGNL